MKDRDRAPLSLTIHLTLVWIICSLTLPWKTAARNLRLPQSKNTDKTKKTGAGKENVQGAIKPKTQFGEGKQKRSLEEKNERSKLLNFKRDIGKQEHKCHSALKVSLEAFCYQTVFLK